MTKSFSALPKGLTLLPRQKLLKTIWSGIQFISFKWILCYTCRVTDFLWQHDPCVTLPQAGILPLSGYAAPCCLPHLLIPGDFHSFWQLRQMADHVTELPGQTAELLAIAPYLQRKGLFWSQISQWLYLPTSLTIRAAYNREPLWGEGLLSPPTVMWQEAGQAEQGEQNSSLPSVLLPVRKACKGSDDKWQVGRHRLLLRPPRNKPLPGYLLLKHSPVIESIEVLCHLFLPGSELFGSLWSGVWKLLQETALDLAGTPAVANAMSDSSQDFPGTKHQFHTEVMRGHVRFLEHYGRSLNIRSVTKQPTKMAARTHLTDNRGTWRTSASTWLVDLCTGTGDLNSSKEVSSSLLVMAGILLPEYLKPLCPTRHKPEVKGRHYAKSKGQIFSLMCTGCLWFLQPSMRVAWI